MTTPTVAVRHVNIGLARRLKVGERSVLTAIGKAPVTGLVAVGPLGLAGDEQADPSVHGGLGKAIYAYPAAHYAFWQAQRRERGVSLFDETLPPGFMGENLTIDGPLEADVFVGDEWHFPHCVLRVSAPREPCFKFNAVMGFAQAGRTMALAAMLRLLPSGGPARHHRCRRDRHAGARAARAEHCAGAGGQVGKTRALARPHWIHQF